ncbi:MAG: magnesium transporter [Rickettsiales bacterium]|nr:magnesium transporter [Rickettsiales bacterium]MCA0254797.1 magnesium transporter [Pseudomonadota bacterium]
MQDELHTISHDNQEKLDQQFEEISTLIAEEKIDLAAELLLGLHYADLADFLDNLNRKYYPEILPAIAEHINSQVLVWIGDGNKKPAIEALGMDVSARLINELEIEDAIEVIQVLDAELKEILIKKIPSEKRKQIIEGFQYPENTVGRALEKDFVSLRKHWSAGQAIDFIRRSNISSDFHAAIIIDGRSKPVGTILLSTLLKSQRNQSIEEIMNHDFKVAETTTELSELAFVFKQYALTIVPVTNKQGKLVGSISIDNILYIVQEQTESGFLHLSGVNNSDISYNLLATTKSRFPWLFVNLITACLTSLIVNHFSDTISKLVILATFMPIVVSMGGNAGTQVMAVTVMALSNREITSSSSLRVILKEVYVCSLNGLLLAIIGIIFTYIIFWQLDLSIIFAVAVLFNFAMAGLFGSAIPIFLDNLDIDPATASTVFLSALTDAIGFLTFLLLAYIFLV